MSNDALREAAIWLHAAYDRPPQTPECIAMLAKVDAALAASKPEPQSQSTNEHTEQSERAELIRQLNDLASGNGMLMYQDPLKIIAKAAALLGADKAGGEPTKRQYDNALRQWDHWKAYALELQARLVKYEGGSTMILNTQPQPVPDDVVKDAERYRFLEYQCRTGTYRGIISRAAIDAAMLKEWK